MIFSKGEVKQMKKKKYKKISIKKIIKFLDRSLLLGATLTSLLYFIYIIVISMYNYLYNRPIRTAVLCGAFGVIMFTLDAIEQNKKNQKRTKVNR